MRERRIARHTLGQEHALGNGQLLEELLGSFVREKHAQLQVEDGLAGNREVEMAGFDNAGMNRAHGDLKNSLAQRRPVGVPLALKRRQDFVE